MRKRKVGRDQILEVSRSSMQNLFDGKYPFLGSIKASLIVNYRVQQNFLPANLLYLKLIASATQYFEKTEFAQAVSNTCNQIIQVIGKNTRFEQQYNQQLKIQYDHFINFCQNILLTTDQSQCDEIISDFNACNFEYFCIGQREQIKLKQILFRYNSWQQLMKSYDELNNDQKAWVGPYPNQFQDKQQQSLDKQKSGQPQQSKIEAQERNEQNQAE